MLKALDHSRLSLFIISDTIFSIPTNSNAIAIKNIANAAAPTGNAIKISANMITSMPNRYWPNETSS